MASHPAQTDVTANTKNQVAIDNIGTDCLEYHRWEKTKDTALEGRISGFAYDKCFADRALKAVNEYR